MMKNPIQIWIGRRCIEAAKSKLKIYVQLTQQGLTLDITELEA